MTVTQFIEKYIDLIDNNNWKEVYIKATDELMPSDVSRLTWTLAEAGINPLEHMDIIPGEYMYRSQEFQFDIPLHVTEIWDSAFESSKLREIIIPSTVDYLGNYAFFNCFNLRRVIIKERTSDLYIANNCFGMGHDLTSVVYEGTMESWNKFVDAQTPFQNCIKLYSITCQDGEIDI